MQVEALKKTVELSSMAGCKLGLEDFGSSLLDMDYTDKWVQVSPI